MWRASEAFPPSWPIGYERALLTRGEPKFELNEIPLLSVEARKIQFVDSARQDHLLSRPPSEVAALLLWQTLAADRLTPDDISSAASLAGASGRLRTGEATTTALASGQRIKYLPGGRVAGELQLLSQEVLEQAPKSPPLLQAIGVLFKTLLIHPLEDGNGRLGRLLFQGSLRQTLGLKVPIFPLGPAFSLNRGHILKTYFAWEFDNNPNPLVDFVLASVEALCRLRM